MSDRYSHVLEQVAEACAAAARPASDIHLIAVSKTHPVALIDELAALGQIDFGENRIAELADKQAAVTAPDLRWHLIGQLQTNKVKQLTSDVIVHSLDRLSLAQKLQQRFSEQAASGTKLRCLLQVNCSAEASKSGVALADFEKLTDDIAAFNALEIVGLMTIAENSTEESVVRQAFATLRGLSETTAARKVFPGYLGWLSMGMSGDFTLAIAEGATHVRIGTAIFGGRPSTAGHGL